MSYSKKEKKKTNKKLDKLAKKKNLDVGITLLYDVSSISDEKRSKDQEKNKHKNK